MPKNTRTLSAVLTAALAVTVCHGTRAADAPTPAPVAGPAAYPPVVLPDTTAWGRNVQRTMRLLATSTPERRNTVRVLFYGQSITEQEWSRRVADDLRKRFPHADLEIENRAIGGFSSQVLIRPAEHDLYPFYPDLLIFHVYGGNGEYEQIIKNVRRRTAAEVLMQTDHVAAGGVQETPDEKADKGLWWDWMMNHRFLPEIARKYGCGLVDVRGGWLNHLKTKGLEPKALLSDQVHLNDRGNDLMAELVSRYLVYRPDLAKSEASARDTVRTLVVGKDVKWKDGKLVLPFEGNRVDVLAAAPPKPGAPASAQIRIDGKKPSAFPELYAVTRPSGTPNIGWPAVIRVDREKPAVLEDWTARVTEVNEDASKFKFEVAGSRTGPDGTGTSDAKFVSKSGRVVIEPQNWWFHSDYQLSKKPTPAGFEVRWQVRPMFVDTYTLPKIEDPTREHATTLAQGLTNDKHTLEIIADGNGAIPIRAIRVYRPPLK